MTIAKIFDGLTKFIHITSYKLNKKVDGSGGKLLKFIFVLNE